MLEQRESIDRLVRQARLSNEEAAALARVGLANYFAGALIMPYSSFLGFARECRYDIERLQTRFGTSFEQVCHRLSTLQRPGATGVPFYFLKIDIAGNVLKRSSATRFQFARFGGPCPLWNVHQAFAQPGRVLVQLANTPDGASYLCIARTVSTSGGSYLSRPRAVAVGLGCEIAYADQTIYSTGLDLKKLDASDPIGPGCRACERVDCRHRALPPIGRPLDVERRNVAWCHIAFRTNSSLVSINTAGFIGEQPGEPLHHIAQAGGARTFETLSQGCGDQPTYVVAFGLLRINAARGDQNSSLTGLMPFDRRLELVESNIARHVQHPIQRIQFKEVMARSLWAYPSS